ncbi:MAG: hypothetical protein ACREBF_03150, partial [Candidatus Micrarchaeales archaeon]
SRLFWSLGLWVFAITVLMETFFALGFYSGLLIDAYLFLVALLVVLLALGSVQLVKTRWIRIGYYVIAALGIIATAYSLAISGFQSLMESWIVAGIPSNAIIYASSLATFPAAIVLIAIAVLGFWRTRSIKMLSIIAGVIVVSVAGTLYIASFPSFLYYAEFVGILLLWLGFYDFKR